MTQSTGTTEAEAEAPPRRPQLLARGASFADTEAFLGLARLYANENGIAFDEAEARYVYGGLPRVDPAVNLLFDGDEAIGFTLVALRSLPLRPERVGREELIFIRRDHRSFDAELLLHDASMALFEKWAPTTCELTIPASPFAHAMAATLATRGFQPVAATTRCQGRPSEREQTNSRLN